MSEFLTEKKLFQETFGGTTFKHLIKWCEEKHNDLEHTIKHFIEWCKERHYAYEHTQNSIREVRMFASYVHYISEEIKRSYKKRQTIGYFIYLSEEMKRSYKKRQKNWDKNYFKFKGINTDIFNPVYEIDTDIFTPVYEYEEPYVDYFMFCGDDNRRIKFISLTVKYIDFIHKSKWIVDPKSIKLQILNFGDESVTEPVIYLSKYYSKY